jgi:hypothetical protein
MKTITLIFLLFFLAKPSSAQDITFMWEPVLNPDLDHYTLYQADRLKDKTGPWQKIKDIDNSQTTTTVTIEAEKNFSWYVTATGLTQGESGPSNTVDRYKPKPMEAPACLSLP